MNMQLNLSTLWRAFHVGQPFRHASVSLGINIYMCVGLVYVCLYLLAPISENKFTRAR